jgi:hypothetical protein
VKYFYNAKNAIPYIQNIKIINAFCDGVSDIKTAEEIAMKKPKMIVDLLAVTDVYIEASGSQASLNHVARGPQIRSRTIGTSTQPIREITGIVEITSNNHQIRRRRDCSVALPT